MKKILIIDDEPDIAESIRLVLESAGYAADKASNALAVIDKLDGYDLVIVDLLMPKMSGRKLLAEMKARKIHVHTIVLSAAVLAREVASEIHRDFGNDVVFVSKTSAHEELIPEVQKKIGAP